MLLTTQYLEEADRLADRIVLSDTGRVVAQGTADELKERVGGEAVEGWLQSFARVPPVSVTVDAVRALPQGGPMFH